MTQSIFDALYAHPAPTLAQLGGEDAIYAERDTLTGSSEVYRVAGALCSEWETLNDQESAAAFLVGAVGEVSPFGAKDLFNVLLDAEVVLPTIAESFETALRGLTGGMPLLRDFALEAWTRLAIGNWATKPNHLRVALEDSGEAEDVTPPLVRALGAALNHWRDDSLRNTLEKLSQHDDVDSDVAMELGLYSVGQAVQMDNADDVQNTLHYARTWFAAARSDEERLDAVAFDEALSGVMDQARGNEISEERFQAIRSSVHDYLNGYLGADHGWRFARAQTSLAWSDLLHELHYAASDRWYNPARTIESLARTLAAETTMVLVVSPEESPGQPGIRALVQPEVQRIGHSNSEVFGHIRRWLDTSFAETEATLRGAVETLLEELESPPPKKAARESLPQLNTIREHLNLTPDQTAALEDAVLTSPELITLLESATAYSRLPRYADEQLINRLLAECHATVPGGIRAYTSEVRMVVNALVQFGSLRLNEGQNGQRAAPWFAGNKKTWPLEHELADDLNTCLRMFGLNSFVEVPNVAGGRVDIAITFDRCTVYIEAKRTDEDQSNADLVASYGTQAAQYASTDIPVAFLAVADYWPRTTRLDLPAAFHVAPLQMDEHSRVYALTTLRAQANSATPSETSASRIRTSTH